MRLGGPLFNTADDPGRWIAALKAKGYRAAYCPLRGDAEASTIEAYSQAAIENDIVIAEVGAWSNPISPDDDQRNAAIAYCQQQLALADRIGARCCVNVTGSRSAKRQSAPHPENLTEETFDLVVHFTRQIIDHVKPETTYFCLEMMPWAWPDSADAYVKLLAAIDRDRCAVHLDPVNILNSPRRYFFNTEIIRDCFQKLGPMIKSAHAKDIILVDKLTTHMDECRPGAGNLDYRAFLREMDKLDQDIPLMMEHLPDEQSYDLAAAHIRSVADELGVQV